ncbi:chloramphenicol-sensitive protein RarD [Colwellia chukchiensis]|uniref:Chloramphenicol-sensitive protein RarD n=1 Tax=Colwellia chukchiensis TaxID=641665 RepID=A0A1H7SJD2_9GAMM|nr:EamA family transporter RarD [Colwellia chukchiensis]SEL72568.1 chloramphenicol-sensitive protein RarD [Colwellia chukchiensis]
MLNSPHHQQEIQGYLLMFGSIIIFSLLPYYLQFLAPVDGNSLFAYRVLLQLIFGFIFLFLVNKVFEFKAIFSRTKDMWLMSLTAPLIALQWWVFYWGPVNGETINIAMGYFLLPITMSLTGRFYFKEKMSPLLVLAVIAALVGVAVELYTSHSFSWVTLLICLGYPPYFVIRRKSTISTSTNFVAENALLAPLALTLLYITYQQQQPLLPASDAGLWLVIGAGLLGTIAMIFFVSASTRLSFTVFGMLNYGEPILLMLVAIFLLNEAILAQQLLSYGCFAIAIVLVIINSSLRIIHNKKRIY